MAEEGMANNSRSFQIDGQAVAELVARYGSPLFVFSERTIRQKCREYREAFSRRYANVEFAWSYKTNYLKAICAVMHQEGAGAEVVSRMEYEKAKALDVPGRRIVLNGPHKPLELLQAATIDGARINVDHDGELDDLEQVAARLDRPLPIGLRVNLDASVDPRWSRFGFHLESGEAMQAARRIAESSRLRMAGLHCHIGTFVRDASDYSRAVRKLAQFSYAMQDEFGVEIEYLDIGGGFASANQPRTSDGNIQPVDLPTAEGYAEAVCGSLLEYPRGGNRPRLIIEAGRALIDEAGHLVTTIVAIKSTPDGTPAYMLDAGLNLLSMAPLFRLNVALDPRVKGEALPSVLYGPLCMHTDVLCDDVALPPLERGQRLILSPVGAYNVTQWMQFIEYRPNVVMVFANGDSEVIRHAEDLTDIERREVLPARWRSSEDVRFGS